MARGNLVSGLPKHHQSDVNLYLFPNMENKKDSQGLSESERERERDEQIYTNREVETMFICGIAMHAIVFYFSLLLCYCSYVIPSVSFRHHSDPAARVQGIPQRDYTGEWPEETSVLHA